MNSFVIVIFISFVMIDVFEILSVYIKSKKKLNSKFVLFKFMLSLLLGVSIIFSFLYNKVEKITNDNADRYITQFVNMNDFIDSSNIIINSTGESYKTLFTQNYYSYMTGSNYEKNLPIVGIQGDYIEFKKNIVSKYLLNRYFNDLKEEHEYTEKKGVLFCAESMLNETQFYIVIKRNNSIYSTKIYVKNNENEDEIIKIVSNKFDSFLS